MYRDHNGRSGPHSIHDARQHAWARLVFGPGAPPPRQRPHPGMLPDVFYPQERRRPSLLGRLVGLLRGRGDAGAQEKDAAPPAPGAEPSGVPAEAGKAGEDSLAA